MEPKPDQMQLEKQKAAEIQRSQHEAEQTQNLQQNTQEQQNTQAQQNAQTQQDAERFWTREVALQEQIPMQSENLSEEMKSAYENVHGQSMGVKSRIWRTERTTKKKREKSNALRAADAQYAHNCSAAENKYDLKKRFAGYYGEKYQQAIRSWLDLSGTKDAPVFNARLLKNATGKRTAQIGAIRDIKNKIKGWKLEDYQNLDDRQIADRYYDIKDKIEKSKAYKDLYDYGLSIGEYGPGVTEADLLAKTEYFIRLEPYIQAKHDLITSPYYSLLRKEDLESLTDDELQQRQEQAEGDMKSFYRTVYTLRKLREDARALMADPLAFQKNEAMNRLQEEKPKLAQAEKDKQRLFNEDFVRENELYEENMKVQWNTEQVEGSERAKALEKRRDRQIRAKQIQQEYNDLDALWHNCATEIITDQIVFTHRSKRQVVTPDHTEEEIKQHYKNMTSDDLKVRFKEYDRVFDYMLNIDLSRFKWATDDELLSAQAAENMHLLSGFIQVKPVMESALKEGMEIPRERQQAILKRYDFFCDINRIYGGRLNMMANPEYGEHLDEEEPKNYDEAVERNQVWTTAFRAAGESARAQKYGEWMATIEYMFTQMQSLGIKDRSKSPEELWKTYQTDEERAEELAQRKALIEPARKAVMYISEEEKRKAELIASIPEYYHAQYKHRVFQSQINHMMPLEEQKQRLLNFASTDEKVRFAEYQAAIDRMLTCDLSRFKIGTDAELLENVEENNDLLNSFAQISELTILAISQGMEIPKKRREEIWKRYSFFIDLRGFYESQLKLMAMDGYAQHTAGEEPKTLEETEKLLKKAQASVQPDEISYYAMMMTKYVDVAAGGKLLDRTMTVQELWDSYEGPKMHEKLANAKAI